MNGYVTEQEPWQVAKQIDSDPVARAGWPPSWRLAAEGLRALAVLLNPVMPESAQRLWQMLGAQAQLGALDEQRVQDAGTWGQLSAGAVLVKGEPLFQRL